LKKTRSEQRHLIVVEKKGVVAALGTRQVTAVDLLLFFIQLTDESLNYYNEIVP
jgi:hypothetical protein